MHVVVWPWFFRLPWFRRFWGYAAHYLIVLRAPVDDLHSNWAYMLIAALAWNIKSWHAMMMHRNHDRHAFIRMEFKRFLDTVIRIPAMVLVRSHAIVVRLVAYTVNLDRFFSAWATTERVQFGPRPRYD